MNQQPLLNRPWMHYIGASALVGIAAALRSWPLQALGSGGPWLTFYPAVTIAAIYGGFYAGIWATAFSLAVVIYLWPLFADNPLIVDFAHWLGAAIFVLSGFLVSAVAEAMHRAQARALTAQKQSRQADQARLLFENSPTGMIAVDAASDSMVQANDKALTIFGYTLEEFVGRTVDALTYPDDREVSRLRRREMLKGTVDNVRFEKRYLRKDGSYFWAETHASTLKDGNGNVTHLIGSFVDLTERKRAEEAARELEQRYRFLFVNMLDGYAYCRMLYEQDIPQDFIYLDVNGKFEELTGLKNVAGKRVSEIIPGVRDSNPELFEVYGRVARGGQPERLETYVPGLGIWFSISVYSPSHDHFVAVFKNITERKETEEELRIAAITFESHEGITVTDANNTIVKVNPTFTKITGYTAEEVIGKNPRILSSGMQNKRFYEIMWKSIDETGVWEGELWDRRKNGEVYPSHLTVSAVKDKDGKVTNYVGIFSDSSASQAAAEEIKHLAFYDLLTGLPNRRLLMDRLQQAMAAGSRSGNDGALLFIDLDDFKTINDTLGHDMGDLLLQQVAQRLISCVREVDTVARFSGDEFMVMLEDLSGSAIEAAAQAETVGGKILAALNEPYHLDRHVLHSTPSIGVTLFVDHNGKVDDLFKQTDIAMYQAKKAGRNTLRFFDPQMQEAVNARAVLEGELREALKNRQFHLHYQIQVDSTYRPVGAEALIRWVHPERGLVSPAHFIPLAEESGLILHIGQWVMETACAQLKSWQRDAQTRELVLAVNVSAKQFRQADFVAQVQTLVQRHAISPTRLKLELTESMLLDNVDETIVTMNALKEFGVQFSLDDFGTGYSSLQYLKRLPLDQLKIDQSFVRDIAVDMSDRAIVRTVIAMAHSLKLDVIAEGVETQAQREFLFNNGCTSYQGYFVGKPVPIEQFMTLLRQGFSEKACP